MDAIQFLYTIFGYPLGFLLYFIYRFICSNVGIAILIFTFIVKLAMLPLYIKQQKSTAKTAVFAPKVQEIQEKYKNNQQRQQEELTKLQAQGYKPMAGCGTMLLSFVILFGVIDVVYKPLTHIVRMNKDTISAMVEESYNVEFTTLFVDECSKSDDEINAMTETQRTRYDNVTADAQKILDYYNEHCLKEGESKKDIDVFKTLDTDTVKIVKTTIQSAIYNEYTAETSKKKTITDTDLYRITDEEKAELDALETDEEKTKYTLEHGFSKATTDFIANLNVHYGGYIAQNDAGAVFSATSSMQSELYALERFGTSNDKYKCSDVFSEGVLRPEVKAELLELYDNLNFLGIPLGQVPKDHMGFPMILVPIVSFLLALAQTFISNRTMAMSNPEAANTMKPMKITMYIMPLFSLWIAFTVPAGAGFYWAISYAFGIAQTLVLNKLYNPQKLREQALQEYNEQHKNKKAVEAAAVKVVNENGKEETVSQKELNRRRLAEARRAQAEKYGEEYHDDGN